MRYPAVLFDLDGTLLDTLEDLADSMNAALARRGHPTHPLDAFRRFVGDGIRIFAGRALPAARRDEAEVDGLVEAVLDEYAGRWREKTRPYAGVETMLGRLFESGRKVGILSNKPHDFTQLTAGALLGDFPFDLIWGVGGEVPKKPDPGGAIRAAAVMGVETEEILYCGDTDTDMETAVRAGMFPAGALWGFRGPEELVASGARVLLPTPPDLLALL